MLQRIHNWQETDPANPLRPVLDKQNFETLHGWEFAWSLLEPIDNADTDEQELALSRQLSPGQKAIYFYWFLDEAVTNAGFIQFYYTELDHYLPPILEGLKLIGDDKLLKLLEEVEQEYEVHKATFDLQRKREDWNPLYQNLLKFEELDDQYYALRDATIRLFENYARAHPDEFGVIN